MRGGLVPGWLAVLHPAAEVGALCYVMACCNVPACCDVLFCCLGCSTEAVCQPFVDITVAPAGITLTYLSLRFKVCQ